MIQYVDIVSGEDNRVDLPVSISGMVVTVGAGSFTHVGVGYQLDEDVETDLLIDADSRVAFGYLVRVVETGEITVLWDTVKPVDWPFVFEADGPYELLHKLVTADIPAGVSDLIAENVVFQCFRIVERHRS